MASKLIPNEINQEQAPGPRLSSSVPPSSHQTLDLAVLAGLEEAQLDERTDLIVELVDLYLEDAATIGCDGRGVN